MRAVFVFALLALAFGAVAAEETCLDLANKLQVRRKGEREKIGARKRVTLSVPRRRACAGPGPAIAARRHPAWTQAILFLLLGRGRGNG